MGIIQEGSWGGIEQLIGHCEQGHQVGGRERIIHYKHT